jgi:pyruvate dehydrogenase E2 component (dihydrolipoamide acetyltransferase)
LSIHEVVVPDVGDSRDVEVSELLLAPGATVAVGDALLVLESDKASVEVTAEVAGTIAAFAVAPGDKVAQGQVLVRIETGAGVASVLSPRRQARQPPRLPHLSPRQRPRPPRLQPLQHRQQRRRSR